MRSNRLIWTAAVGALCALVGAGAGIAGGSAETRSGSSQPPARAGHPAPPPGMLRLGGGPPVHSEAVVPNKARDGFITLTTDAGVVKSLSGDRLTITEGTRTVTYKDVTVTVPSDATVYRNGVKAALSDLREGDHVIVHRSSEGTFVGAFDRRHRPRFAGRRRFGPPPLPPPGG